MSNTPPALLLFSGGIDSVQALHARCVAGERTRTHFVRLSNWEGRAAAETSAARSTIDWLTNKYPGLIEHSTSSFDYGDLRYVVRDHNIWSLVAGIILANPRNAGITQVVRTFHRDSVQGGLDSSHGRAAERAWSESIGRLAKGREIEYLYPQQHLTKGEIMAALPSKLLELTWYCRKPRGGRPCHQCHTCKQVDAVNAGDPLPPLDTSGTAHKTVTKPVVEVVREAPKGNASHAVWAVYAVSLGFDVDGLKRDEIRVLVDAGK